MRRVSAGDVNIAVAMAFSAIIELAGFDGFAERLSPATAPDPSVMATAAGANPTAMAKADALEK